MIQSQSFENAIPFATALAATGRSLVAKPGTPLNELVRLSVPPSSISGTDNSNEIMLGFHNAGMVAVTAGTLQDPSEHSREMDALQDMLAKFINTHIDHARNIVRPKVLEFAESLQEYLAKYTVKDASAAFTIEPLYMASVLNDESFLDTLTPYKDRSVLTPDAFLSLSGKETGELAELIMVGHARTDKLIAEWLAQKPPQFLEHVWSQFFTKSFSPDPALKICNTNDLQAANAFDKSDYALAILLISRKISIQVQESDMPLALYKKLCSQYLEYSGALLVDALKKINLSIKTRGLVVECDSARKIAKVNAEIYNAWLNTGGSPEVILGYIVSGNQPSSQLLIDKKALEYVKTWNSYVTYYRTSEGNKTFAYARAFIETEFLTQWANKNEMEDGFILKNPGYTETVKKMLAETLLNLKAPDLKDPYALALLLIAKVRFYYTSSFQILSDMEAAKAANPDVDVREAALLAVINYGADHLAAQITSVA